MPDCPLFACAPQNQFKSKNKNKNKKSLFWSGILGRKTTMRSRCTATSFLVLLSMCCAGGAHGAVYYLDQSTGDDGNNGTSLGSAFQTAKEATKALTPGDELRIVGQLTNPSYNSSYSFSGNLSDPQLWHGENTLSIREVHGAADNWITITSHDSSTVLRGDGGNIVRVFESSYIRLRNLNVYGEVENIPLSTAKAVQFVYKDKNDGYEIKYRVDPSLNASEIDKLELPDLGSNVPRVSYTDTRGVYVSDSHHIELSGSHVHHMPGGGVRFAYTDYQWIFDNEVDNCARKSYSGTHALVVTYAKDKEPRETPQGRADYRAIIVRNKIHDNYNEIFSWVGTKKFVHAKIDEGKGISLQRNQDFKNGGRILVANNIAYWNGYSGIHSQDGDNVDFFSNTAYMNSYTNTRGEYKDDAEKSGNNIGISIQGGKNCRIVNNIAYIDTSWRGMPISVANLKDDPVAKNNLYFGEGTDILKEDVDFTALATGTVVADPKFSSKTTFRLSAGSLAIGGAHKAWSPCEDYYGKKRSLSNPSIGAVESNCKDGDCGSTASKGVEPSDMGACYVLRPGFDVVEATPPPSTTPPSTTPISRLQAQAVKLEEAKEKAQATKDKMIAKIERRLQKLADKLAKAALAGKKVRKLQARIDALTEKLACDKFYRDSQMDSSLGACVATVVSVRRQWQRRLLQGGNSFATQIVLTEDEISMDALAAAEASLIASGAEGVASQVYVDPIQELEVIPGVDAAEIKTFETQVKEVTLLSPPENFGQVWLTMGIDGTISSSGASRISAALHVAVTAMVLAASATFFVY